MADADPVAHPSTAEDDEPSALSTFDPAEFYSIVVESSGASPISLTGVRDVEKQERELNEVFKTRD